MKNIFQKLKDFYNKRRRTTIIISIIALLLWWITLPVLLIIYIWKNEKFSKRNKIIGTAIIILIPMILAGSASYSQRPPVITITSPQDGYTVQAKDIEIKGTVSPKNSQMTLNGFLPVSIDSDGNFTAKLTLKTDTNNARIEAKNANVTVTKNITVHRIFTEQEKEDMRLAAEKAKKEAELQAAKEKAEQEAYDNSPAGRLCKKNPTWDKDDCQAVASHKFWIGMTLDMLKASLGNPDDVNVSNYGRGNRYQYCYTRNYKSTCLYDTNDDGVIDSYN